MANIYTRIKGWQACVALKEVANDFQVIIVQLINRVILPFFCLFIYSAYFLIWHIRIKVYSILIVFIKIIGIIFAPYFPADLSIFGSCFICKSETPLKLLARMMPAYFTALGTQSSAATIPVTLEQTKKNGVSADIAGFVIPLCATIHLSGSTLKIVACALALNDYAGHAIRSIYSPDSY
ncbi:MAG: cation:dicarboxylase symporter family transporter [Bacteroides graminisolvens]